MSETSIVDITNNICSSVPKDKKIIRIHVYYEHKNGSNMIYLGNCNDEIVYRGFINKHPINKLELIKAFSNYEFYNDICYSNGYIENDTTLRHDSYCVIL